MLPEPNTLAARRIAIVGNGFIGSRVGQLAASSGAEVRILSRRNPDAPHPDVEYVIGDATDAEAVAQTLAGSDQVVYAAGTSNPVDSNADPVADAVRNIAPLISVLEAMPSAGAPLLTFLSSGGTVYGPHAPTPAPEDAQLWPASSYGVMKVAAERFIAMYARVNGFSADILRCANVYGPGQPTSGNQGAIGVFLSLLSEGRAITVYGDGSASRDFVHVDDVVDVALRLAESATACRVLNVGSGSSITIIELIECIAAHLGQEPVITYEPARSADVPSVVLDVTRLRGVLPFHPRSVADGLHSLVAAASGGTHASVNR